MIDCIVTALSGLAAGIAIGALPTVVLRMEREQAREQSAAAQADADATRQRPASGSPRRWRAPKPGAPGR